VLLCYIMQTPQTTKSLVHKIKDQYSSVDLFCMQYPNLNNISQNLYKINALEIKHFLAGHNAFLHLGNGFFLKTSYFNGQRQLQLMQVEQSLQNDETFKNHRGKTSSNIDLINSLQKQTLKTVYTISNNSLNQIQSFLPQEHTVARQNLQTIQAAVQHFNKSAALNTFFNSPNPAPIVIVSDPNIQIAKTTAERHGNIITTFSITTNSLPVLSFQANTVDKFLREISNTLANLSQNPPQPLTEQQQLNISLYKAVNPAPVSEPIVTTWL
jgi:hypothetical protein